MKNFSSDNLYVALDIGTTKICALVAVAHQDILEIIGIGKAPSHGLARGVVIDISEAVASIKSAVREAELMCGHTIESAYIGISGSHIQSINSRGMVPIKHGSVKQYDMVQVVQAAQSIPIAEGQQILHVLPQFYVIDGHHHVQDPLDMHGVRLETQVHIITGNIASVQNLIRCSEMAGIKVRDIVLEPLASAHAILTSDELHLGVGILDIGGGTADFAVYHQGTIRHTKIFPIAGNLFTSDIAHCLKTPLKEAERIKELYGLQHHESLTQTHIEIESLNNEEKHHIFIEDIHTILQYRAQELLYAVYQEMQEYNLASSMTSGLVLTGGGALLAGLVDLSQSILSVPVRIGKPKITVAFKESLNNPMYATAYGLLIHALKKDRKQSIHELSGPLVNRILWRMKSWVFDFF